VKSRDSVKSRHLQHRSLCWIYHRLQHRLLAGLFTIPSRKAWQVTIALAVIYGILYLPLGFGLGFLRWQPIGHWAAGLGLAIGTLFMPGLVEEFLFRLLLLPHPTEPIEPLRRRNSIIGNSILFLLYHLHPWTPAFFREPAFWIGAGLLGIACTVSYLQSRSLWTAVVLHWAIVMVWLVFLGGWAKFAA
jgi:uncharacterized protein